MSDRHIVVLFLVALIVGAAAALAHGDAGWIMAEPRYVDRDGVYCCGPSDCRREHVAKFRETPAGIEIVTGAGDAGLSPTAATRFRSQCQPNDLWSSSPDMPADAIQISTDLEGGVEDVADDGWSWRWRTDPC